MVAVTANDDGSFHAERASKRRRESIAAGLIEVGHRRPDPVHAAGDHASGSERARRPLHPKIERPTAPGAICQIQCPGAGGSDRHQARAREVQHSGAGIADYVFVLARSGEPGARHKNLTFVLVPPSAPGVTLTQITAGSTFTCALARRRPPAC